jgi:cytochrome c-type biogenesis protein CcmH
MKILRLLVLFGAFLWGGAALAVQPDEMLADPTLEARARVLSHELRCMVCQNQSIDDSEASLAHDLRVLVRERLKAGDNDQAVLDFLVARYGQFVLLKPRFELQTAILWLAPFIVLVTGAIVLVISIRRRGRTPDVATNLSPAEEARIGQLMKSAEE